MSLADKRHEEQRGESRMLISSARNGGKGYVLFSRERLGVRVDIAFAADDAEQICAAVRTAAHDASDYSERDDAERARQLLGVTVRGR